ncbi:unnamed protein product [Phytophthora fragariaefolia]|uniref:Unnamed protein product n=1 Tax=Phytophthora fragariaefolia TaxID=1490495 RepID=A0A9W6XWP5_9STRA|nr:unnamed protein product [Phytophthora fragariaefolia]
MADGEAPIASELLALWDAAASPTATAIDDPLSAPESTASPFAVSRALNRKLSLWRGPLHLLRVDAVVHSTSESLRQSDDEFARLLEAAGPEIHVECDAVGACRTGDAVLTRGCRLPAKFILHTVGPRYLPKYRNAAEHALHSCYRSVLTVARENALRSVAIGCVYTQRKGYPREEAAHIAVRTVRRYLEHYADAFDRIIFCVESVQDMFVYERVLPLLLVLLSDTAFYCFAGDSFGEPVIAERKIRIGDLSNGSFDMSGHSGSKHELEDNNTNNKEKPSDDIFGGPENEEAESNILAFRAMQGDPDVERLDRLQRMQEERQRRVAEAAVEEQKRLEKVIASTSEWDYVVALQCAKKENFSDLKALGFCYYAGVDLAGLPVLVYLAGKLCAHEVDLERVLLFVLLTLDLQRVALTSTSPQLSVLYVNADVKREHQPPNSWLKRLFRVFAAVAAHRAPSERPLRNKEGDSVLRFFYVLEPSIGLKFQLLMSKGYCENGGFYNKVVYLQHADMLDTIAPTLQLPPHIYTYVGRCNCRSSLVINHLMTYLLLVWLGVTMVFLGPALATTAQKAYCLRILHLTV